MGKTPLDYAHLKQRIETVSHLVDSHDRGYRSHLKQRIET